MQSCSFKPVAFLYFLQVWGVPVSRRYVLPHSDPVRSSPVLFCPEGLALHAPLSLAWESASMM